MLNNFNGEINADDNNSHYLTKKEKENDSLQNSKTIKQKLQILQVCKLSFLPNKTKSIEHAPHENMVHGNQ